MPFDGMLDKVYIEKLPKTTKGVLAMIVDLKPVARVDFLVQLGILYELMELKGLLSLLPSALDKEE